MNIKQIKLIKNIDVMRRQKDKVVKTKSLVRLSTTSTVTISSFRPWRFKNALCLVEVLDDNCCKVSVINNKALPVNINDTELVENTNSINKIDNEQVEEFSNTSDIEF